MKATKLLYGAFALLALSACSDDKDGSKTTDNNESAYIRVNILSTTSSGSRADDDDVTASDDQFAHGLANESEINNATLVFYDARGNLMSAVTVDNSKITDVSSNPNSNVDAVKTVEAKVALPDGKFPSYMMVFANPVNIDDITTSSLDAIANRTRGTYRGGNGLFAMNNSVYYSETGDLQRAVTVSQADFYQTEEEAANHQAVDVYLDRLAAKVSLKMAANVDDQAGEIGNGETNKTKLTFHVTGWGVNALAKSCYLSKRFIGKTFADMNADFNSFLWNDYLRFRSYWAISPFYNSTTTNKFPDVSDDVRFQDTNGNWQSNADQYTFTYRSYNNLTREIGKDDAYVVENTIHSNYYNGGYDGVNTSAALISVLVKGYYTLGDSNDQETFFIYGGDIYRQADYLKLMANLGVVVGRLNPDNSWAALDDTDVLADIFTIAHPTKPSVGDGGVEENKVTIQFNKNYNNNGEKQYYYNNGTEYVRITAANIAKVNEDLQANCGLATAYNKGMAYFNVPIRHLAPDPKTEDDVWGAGAFGVVRNHQYVLTVEGYAPLSTATIGHGVWNPDQPIVPPSDPNEQYGIKANFNVLSWRLVSHPVILGQ